MEGKAIPQDLVFDIALNLPIKSVLRFKSVSKSWSALFGTSHFTSLHSKTSETKTSETKTKTKIILKTPHPQNRFNVVSLGANNDPYMCPLYFSSTFTIVDSCDGLICVTFIDSDIQRIQIWNPATLESKLVPPHIHAHIDMGEYNVLSFYFNSSNNDYNIVSIGGGAPYTCNAVFIEIYSLRADRWRIVDNIRVPESLRSKGSVNVRNFSTCTSGIPSLFIAATKRIVTFETSTLLFHETLVPDFGPHGYYLPQVMTLDGSLALLARRHGLVGTEAWVLGEIGVQESWSKRFCINCSVTKPYGFWSDYGLVFKGSANAFFRGDDEVVVYVFGEARVKSLEIVDRFSPYWQGRTNVQVVNYKETIVSPNQIESQQYGGCVNYKETLVSPDQNESQQYGGCSILT